MGKDNTEGRDKEEELRENKTSITCSNSRLGIETLLKGFASRKGT